MAKFIRNIVISLLVVAVILCGIVAVGQIIPNQNKYTIYGAINDKYDALSKRDKPAVILVGGSNSSYGFNSESISKEMGMPVINLGLNAGMKMDFYLNMVKANVMKGDIIVLALEYSMYIDDYMNESVTWYVIDNNKTLMKMVPGSDVFNLVRYYPLALTEKIISFVKGPNPVPKSESARRDAYNEYGDYAYPREKNIMTDESPRVEISDKVISDRSMKALKEFNEYCRGKGAEVYASWPSIDELCVKVNKSRDFENYYKKNTGIKIISKIDDYIMPSEYFYNTLYHLNDKGAKIRTANLIRDLKNAK